VLQGVLVKQIERIYWSRLIYGLHLAVYGLALMVFLLTYAHDSTNWQGMIVPLMLWLPLVLMHTTLQSFYELRARCMTYEPVPLENFSRYALTIDLYDEQGNRVESGMELLPRPRTSD
jgi:ABC-type multidrug transport system permease subunit